MPKVSQPGGPGSARRQPDCLGASSIVGSAPGRHLATRAAASAASKGRVQPRWGALSPHAATLSATIAVTAQVERGVAWLIERGFREG